MSPPSSPSKLTDIAAMGIGTLIVFIAIVLVAGIAASVLIQTSTFLEMQALQTGQQTIHEVSSGIKIESVSGHNTSGIIDKMSIEITAKSGSPDIDLGETILELTDSTKKIVLRYDNNFTNQSSIDGDIFANSDFGTNTYFGITVLQDVDNSCSQSNPIINYGDHVAISVDIIATFNGMEPRTDVFGTVICEEGSAGIIGFTIPASLSDSVLLLQ